MDGTKAYEEFITYAVRSDGSRVRAVRREVVKGAVFEIKEIQDTRQRARIIVDEATQSKTSYKLAEQEMPSADCPVPANAESDTILGFRVFKVAKEMTAPPDFTGTRESWVAPDLDCFPLKEVSVKVHRSGVPAP